ncbi:hypothetical protein C8Q76DRAFT_758706 [Earliella scabrosa]|nr:hypothetical protein C8Q76DRAFT_758706 [Earliella scabrosa]
MYSSPLFGMGRLFRDPRICSVKSMHAPCNSCGSPQRYIPRTRHCGSTRKKQCTF